MLALLDLRSNISILFAELSYLSVNDIAQILASAIPMLVAIVIIYLWRKA